LSDQELDRLFAAYRDAVPDPEPSPAFLPKLWEAIEARRTFRLRFQRASRLLITASGAIWLAMAMVLIIESTVSNSRPGPAIEYFLFHDLSNQKPVGRDVWKQLFAEAGFKNVAEDYLSFARTAIFTIR